MFVPVFDILKELENEPSTNAKKDIIRKYENHTEFRLTIQAGLDPLTTYGIKKIPDYKVGKGILTLQQGIRSLRHLVDRTYTGNKAIKYLTHTLENLEFDDALVLERIIAKDLGCGVGASLINSAIGEKFKPVIKLTPYNGCKKLNAETASKMAWPCIVQTKLDGQFSYAINRSGAITWMSRQGHELGVSLPHIEADLLKNFVSNTVQSGELLAIDKSGKYLPRKIGNGIINKIRQGKNVTQEQIESLRYVMWESISLACYEGRETNAPLYRDTFNNIKRVFDINKPIYIALPDYEIVDSLEEAEFFYDRQRELGREGAVLKSASHRWENRHSPTQLKMKAEDPADMRIVKIFEGTGKFKGKLGAFLAETDDGKISVRVGTGFLPEQRAEYYTDDMIGKIVSLFYNELSTRSGSDIYSLTHTVFDEIRYDKDETNTLEYLQGR